MLDLSQFVSDVNCDFVVPVVLVARTEVAYPYHSRVSLEVRHQKSSEFALSIGDPVIHFVSFTEESDDLIQSEHAFYGE